MSHIHIDIADLSFAYEEGNLILDNLSVSFHEHDAVGIIGANGAGKSTFLKLLVGLEMARSGSIRIEEIRLKRKHSQRSGKRSAMFSRIRIRRSS